MSDDVLMEKLTPEGYFQVQQARLQQKRFSVAVWCAIAAVAAAAAVMYGVVQ